MYSWHCLVVACTSLVVVKLNCTVTTFVVVIVVALVAAVVFVDEVMCFVVVAAFDDVETLFEIINANGVCMFCDE